jgi:hypothetical protein
MVRHTVYQAILLEHILFNILSNGMQCTGWREKQAACSRKRISDFGVEVLHAIERSVSHISTKGVLIAFRDAQVMRFGERLTIFHILTSSR